MTDYLRPLDCPDCRAYLEANPALIGAAASVGIERGLTTQQALYAYLRQYHKRGHAEREVR